MQERYSTVTVSKREFHLLFSLTAMAEIVERFGSVEDMSSTLEKDYAAAIRLVPWLFTLLANQGEYLKDGGKADAITEEWAGIHIQPNRIKEIMDACNEAMALGMQMEHQPGEDETVDVVLEEIKKNAEGAGV